MEDRCISCGAVIPEGIQVCPTCEYEADHIQEESMKHISETETKSHKRLVELVKAAGRHLINNADNIVGTDDLICSLSIDVTFDCVNDNPVFPAIRVTREHASREFMYVYENKELF